MSLKQHKPEITMTYGRKVQSSTSTTKISTTIQSIPFNDDGFNLKFVNPSSRKVENTNNWTKPVDGLDLDNITPNRLRDRKSSTKSLGSGEKTSVLGKRPPPKILSPFEDIAESYSQFGVTYDPDLPPPSKRRNTGSKRKGSVTNIQTSSFDVFDFPDDDDNKPTRRKSYTKTYDKSTRGFHKQSAKNKDDKSTQNFNTISIKHNEVDKSIICNKSLTKNFDNTRKPIRITDSSDGGVVKMVSGVNKIHESSTNDVSSTGGLSKITKSSMSSDVKKTHRIVKIHQNNGGGGIKVTHDSNITPISNNLSSNNLSSNINVKLGKNRVSNNSKNDNVKVARGINKQIKKDIFDFPECDCGLESDETEEVITKKKSASSFKMADSTKKASKNLVGQTHVTGQNSFSSANISSKVNSSSTRISRFFTEKTSKPVPSTNSRRSDDNHKSNSNDKKSVDGGVFDLVKLIRRETKTKRTNGSHEQVTNVVNDKTNCMNNNAVQPVISTKKNSQINSKSTVTSKDSFENNLPPPKKSRKNNMFIDIPQTPSRPISEVGTPVSFLSFQQKKKPSGSSVWDVVDAVTSPTDLSLSPRKQNLVAKMSKPIPSKQDKPSPTTNYSKFSISKSKSREITEIKTKDDEILSYADKLLASSDCSINQCTTPSPHNIPSGNTSGGQKTYGQGRTILGQDLDPMSLDSLTFDPIIDIEIDDNDISDCNNLAPKKHALKSSHELREVGDYTRFTDEMDYILDGLENRSLNVRRNSVMDLLSKLLDSDFLLKVRAHNYISKIYIILNGNQDSLIRCCFSFIICMMMEDKHSSESLIEEHDFMEFIVDLLNTSSDPLKINVDSLKQSEKLFINDFKKVIFKSTILTNESQISLKSIALRTLSSISSLRSRHENVMKNKLRESGCLLSIINILKSELELVNELLSAFENGKASNLQNSALDFVLIEQCLKILESATLFCAENQMSIVEDKDLFDMLLELLLYCQVGVCEEKEEASSALECLLGTLRVLINLTNENLLACQYVGSHLGMSIIMRLATVGQLPSNESPVNNTGPLMKELTNMGNSESVDAIKFDVLLLSIGLLINLVETDSNIQDKFRKVNQNPACPGSRKCMRTCTCISRESAVSCLVSLYNCQLEKDGDDTDSNIVAAYMAILLGFLIKNNQANQQLIIERLPDRSVNSLISLLQQFVHFNELVGEEATANGHASGQMLMSSSSLNNDQDKLGNQRRTIGDSFMEIVDMLKSLESDKN